MKEEPVFAELAKLLESMPGDSKEIVLKVDDSRPNNFSVTLRATTKSDIGIKIMLLTTPEVWFHSKNPDGWMLHDLRCRVVDLLEEWGKVKRQMAAGRLAAEASRIVAEQEAADA